MTQLEMAFFDSLCYNTLAETIDPKENKIILIEQVTRTNIDQHDTLGYQ